MQRLTLRALTRILHQKPCEIPYFQKYLPVISDFRSNFKILTSNFSTHVATEKDFLVRLKNDPDEFGQPVLEEQIDEDDLKEEKHLEEHPEPGKRLRTKQYADRIKTFIRKHQVKEALDVLEVTMKKDRVKPEAYIYNLLLGMCGRIGYTKKAFSLYNHMKKRGLKATGGTYTALFNACANSPWPKDGLTRALHLRSIMIEKLDEPNLTNYNAMIKAFGRCGDLETAFSLVDEMMQKRLCIFPDTVNFLFQACIQDKEAGFRHALLVWRKLTIKRIPPNLYTFNLLLRCIRDCEIGDVEVMNETLGKILGGEKLEVVDGGVKLLEDGVQHNNLELEQNLKGVDHLEVEQNLAILRPNLMARIPHLGSILSLTEVKKPEDRLLLVGGMKGFLEHMKDNHCAPDIKTFTLLLDCLPGNLESEKDLQNAMKKNNIKIDIDFLNMLMKKRSLRFDYEGAKVVLKQMKKLGYRPNLITYGILALGCKTKEEALELIAEMETASYRLNTEILGAMLRQACHHHNFSYILQIMDISKTEDVKPNQKFMQCLESFKKIARVISNDPKNPLSESVEFQKGFKIFRMRYKTWLEDVEVDKTEEEHPWTQYRQKNETDARHYREKAVRFKPRHTSLFRVKTSAKHNVKK